MTRDKIIVNSMVLTTALFWGSSYSIRKIGLMHMTPFLFNAIRFFVAFLFVVTAYLIERRIFAKEIPANSQVLKPASYQIKGGILAGVTYGLGSALQQWGLMYTMSGKVGFISSLYTIFVPLISWLVLKKAIDKRVWIGSVFALAGLFLISNDGSFGLSLADSTLFFSSIIFSTQIIIIGHFSQKSNPLILVATQMLTGSLISLLLTILFERGNTLLGALLAFFPIIYSGFFSLGVANVLQSYAQKRASPSVIAIILSFESIFGLAFGMILLHERMSGAQWSGCLLIFLAVMVSQGIIKIPKNH